MRSTNVAFDQNSDLVLDGFGFSQQTLGNGQGLHATRIANVVNMRVGERLGTLDEVVGVSADVLTLCLDCSTVSGLTYETIQCKEAYHQYSC